MKIILINRRHGGSRSIELGRWSRALLSLCCLGLPLGMVTIGYLAGMERQAESIRDVSLGGMQDELDAQARATMRRTAASIVFRGSLGALRPREARRGEGGGSGAPPG